MITITRNIAACFVESSWFLLKLQILFPILGTFTQEWRCLRFLQSGGLIQSVTKVSLFLKDDPVENGYGSGSRWLSYGYKTTILRVYTWGNTVPAYNRIYVWMGNHRIWQANNLWTLGVSWECGMPLLVAIFMWTINIRYHHYQSRPCCKFAQNSQIRKFCSTLISLFSPLMPLWVW
jgi:hypothetical protein